MNIGERIAFEEIYRLHLRGDGKRERKTRRICEEMLGSRACALIRAASAAPFVSAPTTNHELPTTK